MNFDSFINKMNTSPRLTKLTSIMEELSLGKICKPIKNVNVDHDLITGDKLMHNFSSIYQSLRSPFANYGLASLPYYLEQNIWLGAGIYLYATEYIIKNNVDSFCVHDVDGGSGTTSCALSKISRGLIKTLVNSPSIANYQFFKNREEIKNCYFMLGSFIDLTSDKIRSDPSLQPFSQGFDIIWERLAFQMYSKDRYEQILFISQNMKEDGILILDEKFFSNNIDDYIARENRRDLVFKSKFFSCNDFMNRRKFPMDVMDFNEIRLDQMKDVLSGLYRYAIIVWNSHNYYSIIASNCDKNISSLLGYLTSFEVNKLHCYHDLPHILLGTDKIRISKREKGKLIENKTIMKNNMHENTLFWQLLSPHKD